MTTVYVPADSSARSVGADDVAAALAEHGADVCRTGSRGMFWREPLVEVDTVDGRVGYANVSADDVSSRVAAGMLGGADVGECIGVVDADPWLTRQRRVSFARVGVIEPTNIQQYADHGGWRGLAAALEGSPDEVIRAVTESGLRGRGGAGFPSGIKWRTVAEQAADQKFVCCNLDEGDSGTFADRMIAEGDPFTLIEGLVITGYATGATEGYIYCRGEYPDASRVLREAIDTARAHGYLGRGIRGSNVDFDLHVRDGAGAYVCGEETSMLDSLEGKRGEVRSRPPIPAVRGLFGKPTVVNNVLSSAAVPMIMADGAQAYQALGAGRSRGTQVFQLAGNIARGGIVETGFGITLRELVEGFGGGTRSGRPIRAVQVGGPLGAYLRADQLDVPMTYEALVEAGAMLGHGGIVVFDDTADMLGLARLAMEFCAAESCGKCTPCRLGSTRGVEVLDRLAIAEDPDSDLELLLDLCRTMRNGSLCALGGLTPMPVMSAIERFPEDFTPIGRQARA